MKTISRKSLSLAVAALGASLAVGPAAFAQSVAPAPSATAGAPNVAAPAPSASSAGAPAHIQTSAAPTAVAPRSDAQVEARIKQLHGEMKITANQEKEWNDLAQVMRDNAHQMSSLVQERNQSAQSKPISAVDNLRNYQQITDAHAQGLQKLVPAFATLYDKMSPAQKQTADKLFNQRISQRVRSTATPSAGSHS